MELLVSYIISLSALCAFLSALIVMLFLTILALSVILCLFGLLFYKMSLSSKVKSEDTTTVAFFHPYCHAGGGGERVLWTAITAVIKRYPAARCVIYTGDVDVAPDQILSKARERFSMALNFEDDSLEFVYLHNRKWIEADRYPYFTLLMQSLGSVFLGMEALNKRVPDVFIDTMGYAFTLPLFRYLGGSRVGCYVHYPTISSDMLLRVRQRRRAYNNRGLVADSQIASWLKLMYYKVFAFAYGWAGRSAHVTMVNSSWTEDHIVDLWNASVHKVYPPCDVSQFTSIETIPDSKKDLKIIVSLGQFRPEKDHALQIKAMFELRQIISEEEWEKVRLVLIGGCRNAEDEARVKDLKDLCKHLAVEDNVEFKVNIPFSQVKEEMKKGIIGIHTMWNEHFGIAVVEMLAGGLITLAHRSGGPLMDIIIEEASSRNGFLAVHDKEYAAAIAYILNLNDESRDAIRERARSSVKRFSDKEFETSWLRAVAPLF